MADVFVVGAGQTPNSRDGTVRARHLATAAIHAAIADAGIESDEIDALFVGNMTAGVLGQQQQLGGLIADYAGLAGIEAVHAEAACASGAAALRMGFQTIAGGFHDVVAVCGLERMTHVDRETVTRALATAADWELEGSRGESFVSLNAQLMRAYMERYRVAPEAFAPFSLNAHRNAVGNPNALFHKHIDLDDYMESRIVIEPLRLFDVSPVCNGSAAVVLVSAERATRLRRRGRPIVAVAASAAATAPVALARRSEVLHLQAVETATKAVLAAARIRHADVDLFEVHDAYTIMSALSLEAAGFTPPGTATEFARDGRIGPTGDLPLSTMGGLKARGHPVGATGVYQAVEAFLQLTGNAGANQIEGAEVALLQNIGGTASTVVNHVLRRVG